MDTKQFASDKILRHHNRVKEFFETGKSRPITVEFDMSNFCNHNCPYCFGYYLRKENQAMMSRKEAFDILDQIREADAKAVTFTGGGDPLTNKITPESIEYAHNLGMDVALITNGLALTKEISERLVKICTWIRISVDADSPETYKKTHGVSSKHWHQMIQNTKVLVSSKKNTKSDCTIGIGYLTMPETLDKQKMINFTKMFKEIGVDYVQFRPIMPRWDDPKDIHEDDSLELIKECLKYADDNFDVLYSKPKYALLKLSKDRWRPYKECLGANFAPTVCADKKMYVCCHHRGIKKYELGDLSKQSFKEIWSTRQKVFDKIDFKDCPYLCRDNPFNIILWDIKTGKKEIKKTDKRKHENFL